MGHAGFNHHMNYSSPGGIYSCIVHAHHIMIHSTYMEGALAIRGDHAIRVDLAIDFHDQILHEMPRFKHCFSLTIIIINVTHVHHVYYIQGNID